MMRREPIPPRPRPAIWLMGMALLGLSTPAWAYLDPSTGSMILSAVIGLFATAGLAVKTYWYRLKALFRRGDSRPPDAAAATRQAADGEDRSGRDGQR